ncbi:hypothetical protein [Spirosoma panaciterrae]|uniref:hypothetical protein n=1 Tax=Spirosoma panaciterrae TaxID=496058 RepID=UPI0003666229|nr:hypothetical protein [Spirosoma panaciterrae]
MIHSAYPYTPFFPPGPATRKRPTPNPLYDDDQPPQPDWLLILMCALFLLTLFLAWYVDIPRLLH